jgi:hypothetical protein
VPLTPFRLSFAIMSAPSSSYEHNEPKHDNEVVEKLEPTLTYYPTNAIAELTPEHRDYLLKRHGTLELDPIPDMGGADPYNWPAWKVRCLKSSIGSFANERSF